MGSMEIGKKAENIIKELLEESGFKVYRYGYEHTLPKLADRYNLIKGDAAQYIRHMPDFVITNVKNELSSSR